MMINIQNIRTTAQAAMLTYLLDLGDQPLTSYHMGKAIEIYEKALWQKAVYETIPRRMPLIIYNALTGMSYPRTFDLGENVGVNVTHWRPSMGLPK